MKLWLRGEPFEESRQAESNVPTTDSSAQQTQSTPVESTSYVPPPPEDENRKNFLEKLAGLIAAKGDDMEHQLMERKAEDPNFQYEDHALFSGAQHFLTCTPVGSCLTQVATSISITTT